MQVPCGTMVSFVTLARVKKLTYGTRKKGAILVLCAMRNVNEHHEGSENPDIYAMRSVNEHHEW